MSFIKCTKDAAEGFAKFLETSGDWMPAPLRQNEAFRLTRLREIPGIEPHFSPGKIIVILTNKKGICSFDPIHGDAFKAYLRTTKEP